MLSKIKQIVNRTTTILSASHNSSMFEKPGKPNSFPNLMS